MKNTACVGFALTLGTLLFACSSTLPSADAHTADASMSETFTSTPDALQRRPCRYGCDDFEACTRDLCGADGFCENVPIASCPGCRSDRECDDGNSETEDRCNPLTRHCGHQRRGNCAAEDGPLCDDGDPCTIDICDALGQCTTTRDSMCCHHNEQCEDNEPCTTNTCVNRRCVFTRTASCTTPEPTPTPTPTPTTCDDFDRDGAPAWYCGGSDCNDSDPTVYPNAREICNDRRDNNCDRQVDLHDPQCAVAHSTCAGAATITPGTPVRGAIPANEERTERCSVHSHFYKLVLTEPRDVRVEMNLIPTTPPPGQPPLILYTFAAFMRSSCDTTQTIEGTPTSCSRYYLPTMMINTTQTYTRERLPAGTYYFEVQASSWSGYPTEYTLNVTAETITAPTCDRAPVLREGVSVTGNTGNGVAAFNSTCNNTIERIKEQLYQITLTEPRRVFLHARPMVSGTALRVSVFDQCNLSATREACTEDCGFSDGNFTSRVLSAGTHWIAVEPKTEMPAAFELNYSTEAPNALCENTPVIRANGTFTGTIGGTNSRFSTYENCLGSPTGEAVFRLSVATRSRLVLDAIGSGIGVRVFRDCGGALVAGRTDSRVDTRIDAGEYSVVVDGHYPTSTGSVVLNATFLPP